MDPNHILRKGWKVLLHALSLNLWGEKHEKYINLKSFLNWLHENFRVTLLMFRHTFLVINNLSIFNQSKPSILFSVFIGPFKIWTVSKKEAGKQIIRRTWKGEYRNLRVARTLFNSVPHWTRSVVSEIGGFK